MHSRSFQNCPIAIVSAGCMLPDANNLEEFWVRLMEGVPSVRPLPESRWPSEFHISTDRSQREKSYTRFAAHIAENEYERLYKKWADTETTPLCRMRLQILEVAGQLLAPWPKGLSDRKVDVFIGCMHYDDEAANGHFEIETPEIRKVLSSMTDPEADEWRRQFEAHRDVNIAPYLRGDVSVLPHIIKDLQELYKFNGVGSFVDAACASSVAAVDVGVRRLMSGQTDMVITGGVEAHLGPSAFVSFTSMGALANEVCLPFDKRSEGTSLGEGCALFMLQRLEDAIRDGNEILGVIEGVGASSDGNASSLFSPTVNGQRRSYAECHQYSDLKRMAYLECHGTGTPLGDAVEIQSCAEFFNQPDLPIGSTKAIWGHTRGAAGAVGMLKALMILRHKTIPPSRYYKEKISGQPSHLQINTESRPLPSEQAALLGVSSFGFGGINYHIALGEWKAGTEVKTELTAPVKAAFVVGHEEVTMEEISKITDWSEFKISPRSRQQTDLTQLAALVACKRVLDKAHIPLKLVDKHKVGVISASPMGLPVLKRFATAFKYRELRSVFSTMPDNRFAEIMKLRDRYPVITEDTSSGGLNNVIAGRICNFFDFHGKSYNIDSENLSWPMALEAAMNELRDHAELVLVIGFSYRWEDGDWSGNLDYRSAIATLLVNEATAERLALNVKSTLEVGQR